MNIHFKIAFWASIISFVLSILNNPFLTSVKRMVIVFLVFYALAYFMIEMIRRDVRQIEKRRELDGKEEDKDIEDENTDKASPLENNLDETRRDDPEDLEEGFSSLDPEKIITKGIDIDSLDMEKAADAVRALQND